MKPDRKYPGVPNGPPALSLQELQAFAARCPYHQWLGLTVTEINEDSIEVQVPWREELVSNPERRTIHGGVLAALIDATAAYAISVHLGRSVPTVDLRTDYHAVARPDSALSVQSRVISMGRTLATAEARILDDRGVLVASGRGTYFVAPPKPKTE